LSVHVPPYDCVPFDRDVIRRFQSDFGNFPDDYFAVDLETTGLDRRCDSIVQIGILPVKNRKPTVSKSYVVDITLGLSEYELGLLRDKLNKVRASMADRGKHYQWTIELLQRYGKPAKEVAESVRRELGDSPYCVAHYGWQFDFPWLFQFLADNGYSFDADVGDLYDTCLMTKAGIDGVHPRYPERIQDYYAKLNNHRTKVGCKLEDCIERFGLNSAGVSTGSTHVADYDAWCAHLIFEKHREAAG